MDNFKKNAFIALLSAMHVLAFSQPSNSLIGLQFEQYSKASGYTMIKFESDKKATFIMGGISPFNNKSYREECPCRYTINNSLISLACQCSDKELYPDPIEDEFIYEKQRKTLTSKRYKYTSSSAPDPSLKMKYVIWNQKE